MNVLIVGGDRLGNITREIKKEEVVQITHWTGRAKYFQNKPIPSNVDKIVLFYDFVNHNLMKNVRKQSKMYKIPIIYAKRTLLHNTG